MPFVAPSSLAHPLALVTALTKALADEHRLRILALLQHQELCACQIVEVFDLANSTISKHLSILKQAGLLHARKEGRWIYFSLSQHPSLVTTFQWLQSLMAEDPSIEADLLQLEAILQMDPVELCRRQNGKSCC